MERRRHFRHIGHTVRVEGAFLWVMVIAVGVGILLAIALFFMAGDGYAEIGRGGLGMDGHEQRTRGPAPGSAAFQAEAAEEIRQMVEARNVRRQARGQAPLDVDQEIAALTAAPAVGADPALREEVRQLVVARNERRLRQGKPPLDVEEEVERQLRELGT
jgi:hypothetical protein